MSNSLHAEREKIDALDRRLVELLAERQAVVDRIAQKKASADRPVKDPDREAQLLDRLRRLADEADLSPELVERLYAEILDHSVARQRENCTQDTGPEDEATTASRSARRPFGLLRLVRALSA